MRRRGLEGWFGVLFVGVRGGRYLFSWLVTGVSVGPALHYNWGMTLSQTWHVLRTDAGWAVKAEGHASRVYRTKKAAIEDARRSVLSLPAGQMVVHRADGTVSQRLTHGLPRVRKHPIPSSRAGDIEMAVARVVMDRLRAMA